MKRIHEIVVFLFISLGLNAQANEVDTLSLKSYQYKSIDYAFVVSCDTTIGDNWDYKKMDFSIIYNDKKILLFEESVPNRAQVRYYSPLIADFCYSTDDNIFYFCYFHKEQFRFWKIKANGETNEKYQVLRRGLNIDSLLSFEKKNTLKLSEEIINLSNYLYIKDIQLTVDAKNLKVTCYTENKMLIIFSYNFTRQQWVIERNRKLTKEEIEDLKIY